LTADASPGRVGDLQDFRDKCRIPGDGLGYFDNADVRVLAELENIQYHARHAGKRTAGLKFLQQVGWNFHFTRVPMKNVHLSHGSILVEIRNDKFYFFRFETQ